LSRFTIYWSNYCYTFLFCNLCYDFNDISFKICTCRNLKDYLKIFLLDNCEKTPMWVLAIPLYHLLRDDLKQTYLNKNHRSENWWGTVDLNQHIKQFHQSGKFKDRCDEYLCLRSFWLNICYWINYWTKLRINIYIIRFSDKSYVAPMFVIFS